ncbi:MAG: tRNA 2-selenouridine(34) synthase MnmH [Marinilabiliales bacterium]|nr:tRNA 2-selenouridine(34) synthase MnmH [Marinilabiliales bacterium]
MATLAVTDFIKAMENGTLLDIRTPAEYAQGHLPGALSFPLFSDDERVIVGTLYKQKGRDQAVLKGLELVGPRLKDYVVAAGRLKGALYLYCWRGGMRSNSMAWLLQTAGREVFLLEGGYKSYRTYGRELMTQPLRLIMINGPTGSGKTEVLHALARNGHQVLDLEGLANHKGSSFGGIGQPQQPGNEQFSNLIAEQLLSFDRSQPIWIEGESQMIGKVTIPMELFQQMNRCPAIRLDTPRELRMERLIRDYACFPKEALQVSLEKISRRMGGKATQDALEALLDGDFRTVADLTLIYYDKTYAFSMTRRESPSNPFVPSSYEPEVVAREIPAFAAACLA